MPTEVPPGAGVGPVTDAHLHLWDLAESGYGWLAGAPEALRRTVTPADVLPGLRALGVTRVVLVQADDTPSDTAHLRRTAAAIEREGVDADVVGWLPLTDPDAVAAALADPAHTERLVGVRHLVHDDPDPGFLDRPAVGRSLDLLAEAGLPLDVPDAHPRHMAQVDRVAARHPRLTLVLDHLGKPPLGDEPAMRTWRELLAPLADRPGVVAKLSGLTTSGDGDLAGAADHARSRFGADRLMVGSDWPIAPEPLSLDAGFAPLLAHVRTWSAAEVAAVHHGTAARVYRRSAGA